MTTLEPMTTNMTETVTPTETVLQSANDVAWFVKKCACESWDQLACGDLVPIVRTTSMHQDKDDSSITDDRKPKRRFRRRRRGLLKRKSIQTKEQDENELVDAVSVDDDNSEDDQVKLTAAQAVEDSFHYIGEHLSVASEAINHALNYADKMLMESRQVDAVQRQGEGIASLVRAMSEDAVSFKGWTEESTKGPSIEVNYDGRWHTITSYSYIKNATFLEPTDRIVDSTDIVRHRQQDNNDNTQKPPPPSPRRRMLRLVQQLESTQPTSKRVRRSSVLFGKSPKKKAAAKR